MNEHFIKIYFLIYFCFYYLIKPLEKCPSELSAVSNVHLSIRHTCQRMKVNKPCKSYNNFSEKYVRSFT